MFKKDIKVIEYVENFAIKANRLDPASMLVAEIQLKNGTLAIIVVMITLTLADQCEID